MTEMKHSYSGNESYDEKFFSSQKGAYNLAQIMLPLVNEVITPKNVIDVGCGIGAWLAVWQNFGVEIHGLDGDYVDRTQLLIPAENFHPANLEERFSADMKFDLVESLEVAEHLSSERADSFIYDLTELGDVILFSAAIPGQGGTNHVNEQWQSYWAKKFLYRGYVCIDFLRSKLWNDKRLPPWRRQNTFIYIKRTALYRYPELQKFYLEHHEETIYDLVHPDLWIDRLFQFQNFYNQVQAQLSPKTGGGIIALGNVPQIKKFTRWRKNRRAF